MKKWIIRGVVCLVIVGLLATTIIFAVMWSSANSKVSILEQEKNNLYTTNSGLEKEISDMEPLAESLSRDTVRQAGILANTGIPTMEYLNVGVRMAGDMGKLSGLVMKANGKSDAEINKFIDSLKKEFSISQ